MLFPGNRMVRIRFLIGRDDLAGIRHGRVGEVRGEKFRSFVLDRTEQSLESVAANTMLWVLDDRGKSLRMLSMLFLVMIAFEIFFFFFRQSAEASSIDGRVYVYGC